MPRLQEDDAAAFDAFVVARRGSLMRTALLLTGNRGRAEDLVQTALLETYRRWPRLRDRADPVGYARKTLVTTHLNPIRRRSWHEPAVGEIVDVPAADDVGRVADRLRLRAALMGLPPRMRAVLVLRFFDDLSERDTAELLGCGVGTVQSQAARGPARLPGLLGGDELRAELRAWADELDPAAGPAVTAASLTELRSRRLRSRAALLATAVVVVVLAVAVPLVLDHGDDRSAPAGPSLYDLPTRGPLAEDQHFLAAAVRLPWQQIDPPTRTRHVVWAGDVPGGQRWVLVAGANTAAPAGRDPRYETDPGMLSPTALALFTGPAGAPADRLSLAGTPHGRPVAQPFAVQDAQTGALLVVAAPGDTVEVSGRPTFRADGTEDRTWDDVGGTDGVAVRSVAPLRVPGPTPVGYRVFRDGTEVSGVRGPDVVGTYPPADVALATVRGPLLVADDAQQAAAQLVSQLGLDQGEPDALIPWQGRVPGPDAAGAAAQRTYAFSCTVLDSDSGNEATTFVIAAPPEAVHARLYGAGGEVVAEVDLTDGVAVLPEDLTVGQRPASSVEAFTTDGTSLLRTRVLNG